MRVAAMATCCALLLGCASQHDGGGRIADAGVTADGFPRQCSKCHGSDESPAPPADLLGEATPARRGVGAHRAHLFSVHGLAKPVPCESCHIVPPTSERPGHMDSLWPAKVVFGGLALARGAKPVFTAEKGTGDERKDAAIPVSCSSVYCHGAGLSGGIARSPIWNAASPADYRRCDACHGFPPAVKRNQAPHPADRACSGCHSQTVSAADDSAIAHPENHINGRVEVKGASIPCNACHGDPAAKNPAPGDPDTAPALDVNGNAATTAMGVGAHQSHLRAKLSAPVACGACHTVPTAVDSPGHNIGSFASAICGACHAALPAPGSSSHGAGTSAPVVFAALARVDGATPMWNRSSATCSNYCHGQTLRGGRNTRPQWTQVDGTQAACGTCHGLPPPAPHSPSKACSTCHDTVAADDVTIAKPAQHVDGTVNVIGGGKSCNSCHGSQATSAPPRDTLGNTETSALGVGAHQKHLGTASAKGIGCSECHVVPSSMDHASGAAEVTFGARSRTGGLSPAWNRASATCASTWCHGPTGGGGSNHAPVWTRVGAGQAACGTCHGLPPPAPHAQSTACSSCHDTVGADDVTIAKPAQHVDGTVNVTGGSTCHSCHGSESSAAPPRDTHGNTATDAIGVGAHQRHLQGAALSNPIACDQCHLVPSSMSHSNGAVELTWGALARTKGLTPRFTATAATCSDVWCHAPIGYRQSLAGTAGGSNHAPTWTRVGASQAACGTCHGNPPGTGAHGKHVKEGCDACHSGYSSSSVNKANHVNGKIDVGGSRLNAGSYSNGTCAQSCHKARSWSGGEGEGDDGDDD
jgi:predicted CxxxxCH...CXXCH cytochrome family protein